MPPDAGRLREVRIMGEAVWKTVDISRQGPVIVVTIFRPERRNAVDSATAASLLSAFAAFEEDESAAVAVLTGAGGTFCAGADLKALSEGDRRPVLEAGPGPMGPTRLELSKPVIAAIEGHAVAGDSSSPCGAICGWRRPTPCSASTAGASACPWWTGARSASPA